MRILKITALTTDYSLERFLLAPDMREQARRARDAAMDEWDTREAPDTVLELHGYPLNAALVLWSPDWRYALVNECGSTEPSFALSNEDAPTPEHALRAFLGQRQAEDDYDDHMNRLEAEHYRALDAIDAAKPGILDDSGFWPA